MFPYDQPRDFFKSKDRRGIFNDLYSVRRSWHYAHEGQYRHCVCCKRCLGELLSPRLSCFDRRLNPRHVVAYSRVGNNAQRQTARPRLRSEFFITDWSKKETKKKICSCSLLANRISTLMQLALQLPIKWCFFFSAIIFTFPAINCICIFCVCIFVFYDCIVQLGFSHEKFGLLSPGKASCDRVALPNLPCMLDVLVFP